MWSFKRNKELDNSDQPAEVQDYYQEQGQNRKGIALLLGVAGLIVALLLATLIYFSGRWVYRHTFGKPKATPTTTGQTSTSTGGASTESTTTPATTGGSNTTPTSSTPASSTPTAPTTGAATSNPAALVNTGPSGQE